MIVKCALDNFHRSKYTGPRHSVCAGLANENTKYTYYCTVTVLHNSGDHQVDGLKLTASTADWLW